MTDATHPMKTAARTQFDAWASSYDGLVLNRLLFQPSYRAAILELVRHRRESGVQAETALDIGCGTGTLLAMLLAADRKSVV